MATKANPADQIIQPRDINAYNQVYQCIEKKQYQKAISSAATILNKYPTNGEMTCAKGMCQASIASRGDETTRDNAIKLMKQGLMWNLKSSRSWQLQGHYYRNDKQYVEALKSYTQVIKLRQQENPDQVPTDMLRDMTTVQAQLRKWDEYIDTRRLLLVNGNFPQLHWPGFIIGCHLGGRNNVAIEGLNSYQNLVRTSQLAEIKKHKKTIEESELCLYRVEIYYQMGDYQSAYNDLIKNENNIIDIYSFNLMKVRLMIKLKLFTEAIDVITKIILTNNNEQLEGILLFFQAKEIQLESFDMNNNDEYIKVRTAFNELITLFPKSSTLTKLSLMYLNENDLELPLLLYIKPNLSKGVPSLFKTLKSLYVSTTTAQYIEKLMLTFIESLTTNNTFPNDTIQQSPTTILSTYIYLAQHYDYYGQIDKALSYIDLAEKHTPTFIDLYVYRAKIYKHAGNHQAAYYWIDFARNLDLADRWLNVKCSVYAYQAGHDDHGERTTALFIKDSTGIHNYQYAEQASWWFYQTGLCHMINTKHYPMAIKYLTSIDDFFTQYQESVYDYHQYSVKKAILRAYGGMLNYLNCVKTHKFYLKSILPLIYYFIQIQYQINYEQIIATPTITNDYNTNVKKDILTNEEQSLQDYYTKRELYQWRLEYITKRNKKRKQDEEEQVNEAEVHNAGAQLQNPNYDIYGQEYFTTLTTQKFAKNDYNTMVNESLRYINMILDHIKTTHVHAQQSNVADEIQNNSYTQTPPSLLFLSIQSNILTQHPLRALQHLQQVLPLINNFKDIITRCDNNIVTTTTIDQLLKLHYNGVYPWFQIKSSTPQIKMKLLGSYYDAQYFISQMLLSNLCLNEEKATMHMNNNETIINSYKKQYEKAIQDGYIVTNVADAIQKRIELSTTFTSPCKQIITLTSALLAAYYTSTTINFQLVQTTFDTILNAIPTPFEKIPILRAPIQSMVYVCNLLNGQQYVSNITKQIPIITGLITKLEPKQCTTFTTDNDQNAIEKLLTTAMTWGNQRFPYNPMFYINEELQTNQDKYNVDGPVFITPPEKDL